MGVFSLKIKTKKGQHIISSLCDTDTIATLKQKIADLTQIASDSVNILSGFPPKQLDYTSNSATLSELKIVNGDTLIIDEKPAAAVASSAPQNRLDPAEDGVPYEGILLKKVVPSDNSCLFTSIGYVLNGKIDTDCGGFMRHIIAQHVENDKETYNEAVLGRPNAEYCQWIQQPDTWGGAIEVSILSSFYGIEIAVVDITNAIINRFGEDKNYGTRVFLLFDGIHYDALYLEMRDTDLPKTMFDIEDNAILVQAENIAQEAKSSRQFTDLNKFTLKCYQCDKLLTGQSEAQQHAKSSGHTNFGEV